MALMQRLIIVNSIKKIRPTRSSNFWNLENNASIRNVRKFSSMSSSYPSSLNIANQNVSKRFPVSVQNSSALRSLSTAPTLEFVTLETKGEGNKVGVVTINRPKALNALNDQVVKEISNGIVHFSNDPNVGVIILTGGEKAFAAGADIKELGKRDNFSTVYSTRMLGHWDEITRIRKPIIAAVNGFALGGGCELAMMCDIIVAGEKAKFGQPEINIGTIPGAGGTQRLTHAVGKSRAMQICLTGEMINAQQAEAWGLVSSVHPPEKLLDAAIDIGNKIAKQSKLIAGMVKESVNNAFELSLQEGLRSEKFIFYSTFATVDRKEGMQAFIEKRKPNFTDK